MCSCSVHQCYHFPCIFLLHFLRLSFFISGTYSLICLIMVTFFPCTHSRMSLILLRTRASRLTSCLEPSLSAILVPYIKPAYINVNVLPRTDFHVYSYSRHHGYFLTGNQLSPIFLLCTSRLPFCPEQPLLHLLAPYIKVNFLPETYPLVCSCSVHQGYFIV